MPDCYCAFAHPRPTKNEERQGVSVAIPAGNSVCPITGLKNWLTIGRMQEGLVFRPVYKGGRVADIRLSDRAVAMIIKHHATQIGLDPSSVSGHSLGAGFLTSSAQNGASTFKMKEVLRHKSIETLQHSVRSAESLPRPCRRWASMSAVSYMARAEPPDATRVTLMLVTPGPIASLASSGMRPLSSVFALS